MKFTTFIIYFILLIGFLFLLTSCNKKIVVDKAKDTPKVEIVPFQPSNKYLWFPDHHPYQKPEYVWAKNIH